MIYIPTFYIFVSGMLAALCWVVSIFFFQFWRKTKDVFFLLFTCSFFILAVERMTFLFIRMNSERVMANYEEAPWVYILRLIAFLTIIVAIVQKNLRSR